MTKRKISTICTHTILIIFCIFSIIPILYMFFMATNYVGNIQAGRVLPGSFLMENFKTLSGRYSVWRLLWNSLKIAVSITTLSLLFSSFAGYAFEVYHDKVKDHLITYIMFGMMVPFCATMAAQYKLMVSLGAINTPLAVILPAMVNVQHIFLFRQSTKAFPRELIDAARIDGQSEIGIFFKMYVPNSKASFTTCLVMSFMSAWNGYMWPNLVLGGRDQMTLPMMIGSLVSANEGLTDWGACMVGCSLCALPPLIIFACMQKSFMNSVAGAVKA